MYTPICVITYHVNYNENNIPFYQKFVYSINETRNRGKSC